MSQRSPRIAAAILRAAFDPSAQFGAEPGAELEALISAFCADEDADWVFEAGKKTARLRYVRQQVDKLIGGFEERRIIPPLRASGNSATYYRFVVIPAPGDDADAVGRRARYRLHQAMLDSLRALDDGDFEYLCEAILREVGCTTTYVTRGSQDYGVDFFGRMPVAATALDDQTPTPPVGRVLGGLTMMLFGQAKRYGEANTIDDGPLKELESTWADLVRGSIDRDLHPNLETGLKSVGWKSADPVFFVFATTSSYTRRAISYARRAGMATLDGDQIAQLLLEVAFGVEQQGGAWVTSGDRIVAATRN